MPRTECVCGSKKFPWILYDAQGISCGYVCEDCEAKKKATYRPEIFTGYTQADVDENIDEY